MVVYLSASVAHVEEYVLDQRILMYFNGTATYCWVYAKAKKKKTIRRILKYILIIALRKPKYVRLEMISSFGNNCSKLERRFFLGRELIDCKI